MQLPGKQKQGRPKGRFMDAVKEDMAVVEVTKEDTEDRILAGESERKDFETGPKRKRAG